MECGIKDRVGCCRIRMWLGGVRQGKILSTSFYIHYTWGFCFAYIENMNFHTPCFQFGGNFLSSTGKI